MNLNMQGFYKIEAHKLDGTSRVLADWFPNLILNNGLNILGTSAGALDLCFVGSGTSSPAAGQTALDNPIAQSVSATQTAGNVLASNYCFDRRVHRFSVGSAAGNLSEVGVGLLSNNLFSRARILDGGGNPTTITVLSDEVLDVTYEVRVYWPTALVSGSVNIPGVGTTSFNVRAGSVGSWTTNFFFQGYSQPFFSTAFAGVSAIGSATDSAFSGGTNVGSSSTFEWVGSYSTGSFSRAGRITFGLNDVTTAFNGILLQDSPGVTHFRILFANNIPKTPATQVQVNLTFSWSRRSI